MAHIHHRQRQVCIWISRSGRHPPIDGGWSSWSQSNPHREFQEAKPKREMPKHSHGFGSQEIKNWLDSFPHHRRNVTVISFVLLFLLRLSYIPATRNIQRELIEDMAGSGPASDTTPSIGSSNSIGSGSGLSPADSLYQVRLLAALRSGTCLSFSAPPSFYLGPWLIPILGDPALIHPFLTEIGKDRRSSTSGQSQVQGKGNDYDTGAAALHLAIRCASSKFPQLPSGKSRLSDIFC